MRNRTPALESVHILQISDEAYARFLESLNLLRKKRLIKPESWKKHILPGREAIGMALDEAWANLHRRASGQSFPDLVREDQVIEQFHISQKTLYRRRKKRELPYVRDHEGIIWYPLYDLLEYVLKFRATSRHKPGRPRKF